ncbi:nuclear transport factor 2 family protein [Planctomycetota bacterium]
MSKTVKLCILLTCATTIYAVQKQSSIEPSHAAIKKAVLAANTKLIEAANSMDADKFFQSIIGVEPGCIIQDGKLYANRQDALDDVSMGFESVVKMTRSYDQTHVTVISSETALFTGTGKSHVETYSGRTIDSPFAVSMLFVLQEGQWKVLHGHFSSPNPR